MLLYYNGGLGGQVGTIGGIINLGCNVENFERYKNIERILCNESPQDVKEVHMKSKMLVGI